MTIDTEQPVTVAPLRLHQGSKRSLPPLPDAIYVGPGSPWETRYIPGREQVRMPGLNGDAWEREGRSGKRSGEQHAFVHAGSTFEKPIITFQQVEDATPEQCVEMYRACVTGTFAPIRYRHKPMIEEIRAELAGKHLSCTCPPGQACHADVLLEIANSEDAQ